MRPFPSHAPEILKAAKKSSAGPGVPDFSLVPDCGGKIVEVAMAIIGSYFLAGNESKLKPLANLIESFDDETEVKLLVDNKSEVAARDFVDHLRNRTCLVTFVPTAPACSTNSQNCLCDVFIQDKFSVADKTQSDTRAMFRSSFASYNGTHCDEWLDSDGKFEKQIHSYWPEGGDCLIGEDFWIVNTDIYLDQGIKDIARYKTFLEALEARQLFHYGFTKVDFDKSYLYAAVGEYDTGKRRKSYINVFEKKMGKRFTRDSLIQYFQQTLGVTLSAIAGGKVIVPDSTLYHVDLMIGVTGEDRLVLIGRPLDALDPAVKDALPENWLDEHTWKYSDFELARRAHEVKTALEDSGFKVIATPMPAIWNHWYTYNNVLVENSPRKRVWLPQYGDAEDWLKKYDDYAYETWKNLGFEVVRICGWSAFLNEGGAVRCSTKVLRRA